MGFGAVPPAAAWRHHGAREGFEVAFFSSVPGALMIQGSTAAVEDDDPWAVRYRIQLGPDWRTVRAEAVSLSRGRERAVVLEHDGLGNWTVNGAGAPHLAGCLDVDLESSALTNAFPVHRLGLAVAGHADAPAAYVRAIDAGVERLDQRYVRLEDGPDGPRYGYEAPAFGFTCELAYDGAGLVSSYPGIATRNH